MSCIQCLFVCLFVYFAIFCFSFCFVPISHCNQPSSPGFPRDLQQSKQHLSKALKIRRKSTGNDPWTFTLLGFLLSIDSPFVAKLNLKVLEGPEVIVTNPEILNDAKLTPTPTSPLPVSLESDAVLDRVGVAFWEAAERQEAIGSIVFASMVRRGLTEVPISWYLQDFYSFWSCCCCCCCCCRRNFSHSVW